MSFGRSIYYSAVIGGFGAFLGWLVSELLLARSLREGSAGSWGVALAGCLVGGAVGVAITVVAGMANAQWKNLLRRSGPGALCGGIGGGLGALLGNLLFAYLGFPRSLGWLVMGLGIGVADGLYERSGKKIRNGLAGGALGGLVAGLLFDFIPWVITQTSGLSSPSGMASRATGFVITGVSIGALIGLAQVVWKEAWLTVMDGYRTGRQLVLTQEVTVLGRGDHLPLPFLGPGNRELEIEHLRIIRQPAGTYVLEDAGSRLGTRVNNRPVAAPVVLRDGDIIRLGSNLLRFNERKGRAGEVSAGDWQPSVGSAPPPPPGPATSPPGQPPPLPRPRPDLPGVPPPPPGPPKPAPPAKHPPWRIPPPPPPPPS